MYSSAFHYCNEMPGTGFIWGDDGGRERAQWMRAFSLQYEDLNSTNQLACGNHVWLHLSVAPELGGERKILRADWPINLVKTISFQFSKRPLSRQ